MYTKTITEIKMNKSYRLNYRKMTKTNWNSNGNGKYKKKYKLKLIQIINTNYIIVFEWY